MKTVVKLILSSRSVRAVALYGALAMPAAAQILIGQSADLSGGNREQAKQVVLGANALFEAVNAQGGVRGKTIKLITLDDAGKADKARQNTDVLLQDHKVIALFGYTNRATAEAGMAKAIDAKALFFAPASGGETLRQSTNRYVFHVRVGYGKEYRKIIDTLATTGVRSFGMVVNDDDLQGSNRVAIEDGLKAHGLTPQVIAAVPRNEANFASASDAVLKASPAVLVVAASGKSVAPLILNLKKRGYTGRFATMSFLGSTLPGELGAHSHGLMLTNVVPPPTRTVDRLVRDAQRDVKALAPQSELTFASLEGYMSAKVLVEGLRRAATHGTEPLIVALESIRALDLSDAVQVSFGGENRQGSGFVDIAIVDRDGKLRY